MLSSGLLLCVLKHRVSTIHVRVTSCFAFFKEIIHITYLELHLTHRKTSINASHLPVHYCLLRFIWQVWGPLVSAFPTSSRTLFSTMLPHTPSHSGFLTLFQRYQTLFLPQSLCMCCSLCLEYVCLKYLHDSLPLRSSWGKWP